MTEQTRIIKKYANRRLYDTTESRYITLVEIKDLVLRHIHFQIKDAKTQQDLTNAVLLQIIFEEENFNQPLFTTEILKSIIRFYGHPAQHSMSQFLEQSMQSFSQTAPGNPLETLKKITEQNLNLFKKAWENFSEFPDGNAKKQDKKESK